MSRSALALCLLAAVCGAAHPSRLRGLTPEPHGCIVGGEPVDISQFPWQISLEEHRDGRLKHFCGGSIISSTWVLTAAHCTRGYTPQQLFVRAGSSFRENGGTFYRVANITEHGNYHHILKDYDISLLEISKPIVFGDNVQAVILGWTELAGGTVVNMTGWGYTSIGGCKPQQLHAVTTTIVDRDTCKAAYVHLIAITKRMICAGQDEGCCKGDSGGPLVVGNTQYGIVSFAAANCTTPGYPGVLANVPALRLWIKKKSGI